MPSTLGGTTRGIGADGVPDYYEGTVKEIFKGPPAKFHVVYSDDTDIGVDYPHVKLDFLEKWSVGGWATLRRAPRHPPVHPVRGRGL